MRFLEAIIVSISLKNLVKSNLSLIEDWTPFSILSTWSSYNMFPFSLGSSVGQTPLSSLVTESITHWALNTDWGSNPHLMCWNATCLFTILSCTYLIKTHFLSVLTSAFFQSQCCWQDFFKILAFLLHFRHTVLGIVNTRWVLHKRGL